MSAIDPQLRFLEIGEFSLIKRCIPEQTAFIFTGAKPQRLPGIAFQPFSPGTVIELLRGLRGRAWDLVFCYPPALPLWDRRRGVAGVPSALARLMFRFRGLGTYVARYSRIPLVVLDYNDMTSVSIPGLPLLDRSVAYFKRELPLDSAKALFNVVPRFRTHRRVMSSAFFERNRTKFRPISAGVPEETVQIAKHLRPEKTVDVFFAGSRLNSEIRRRGFDELGELAKRGYTIDVSSGGLSKREYLERCARSWLTWSPEGFGWECLRHYEASLCGSVPLLSTPAIQRYQPLQEGVHAHIYSDQPGGLFRAVETALAQKPALELMAGRARQHVLAHHTHERICEYIVATSLDAVKRHSPLDPGVSG
jgi:glycosyl transferase family 1